MYSKPKLYKIKSLFVLPRNMKLRFGAIIENSTSPMLLLQAAFTLL